MAHFSVRFCPGSVCLFPDTFLHRHFHPLGYLYGVSMVSVLSGKWVQKACTVEAHNDFGTSFSEKTGSRDNDV